MANSHPRSCDAQTHEAGEVVSAACGACGAQTARRYTVRCSTGWLRITRCHACSHELASESAAPPEASDLALPADEPRASGADGPARPFARPILERFRPHFEALNEERLLVRRCADCGRLQWPPRACCRACNAQAFTWAEMPREGTIYTFTVCFRAFHPWFAQHVPFGVVVTEVEPGVRLVGNCFGPQATDLRCGQRVTASFRSAVDQQVILEWDVVGR